MQLSPTTFIKRNRVTTVLSVVIIVGLVVSLARLQVLAHGGDEGKVHSCLSPAGLIRIVGEDVNCLTGETALDWNLQTKRYEGIGTTLDPITPAATWMDVPNAAITEEFGEGEWKVTYGGVLKMSGGNGTAYIRIQVRPTGGTAFEVGQQTYYRFQSPLPGTEASTEQVYTQALVDIPAGEVTIVPQVYGPTAWSLMGGSSVIVEK